MTHVNVKFIYGCDPVHTFPGFKEDYDTEKVSIHELILRDYFKEANVDKDDCPLENYTGFYDVDVPDSVSGLSICYNYRYGEPRFNGFENLSRKVVAKIEPSDVQRVIDNYFFVTSERESNFVTLRKYSVKDCTFSDTLVITAGKEDFQYSQDLSEFMKDATIAPSVIEDLKHFICNIHEGHPAFDSIRDRFFEIFRKLFLYDRYLSDEKIKILGHMVSENFLLLVETDLKSGLFDDDRDVISDMYEKNPFITHKPYPNVAYSLSKAGNELVRVFAKNSRNCSLDIIATIKALEDLPNFGPNGLKMLIELMEINFHDWQNLNQLYLIFETYDIMPKVFFDRAIRYSFYEGSWVSDYIQIVCDYIHMREQLGFAPEKKMPKDIVSMHDSLQQHIQDVKDEAMKAQFRDVAKKNSALAEKFNEISKSAFIVVSPKESKDLIEEGQQMHHCVGSYVDRYADGYSQIYFVRKADAPEISYATIELHDGELIQARGKYNTNLDNKTMKFINNFADFVKGEK